MWYQKTKNFLGSSQYYDQIYDYIKNNEKNLYQFIKTLYKLNLGFSCKFEWEAHTNVVT